MNVACTIMRQALMFALFVALIGLGVLSGGVPDAGAATTFIGATVESVDSSQQTITFRSREGQSWTLGVADPNMLKHGNIARGDQASIEVDPKSDKIIKIVRLEGQASSSERPQGMEQPEAGQAH
jgi:hypothetical protein